MPHLTKRDAAELVKKRHMEWVEHQERWRWALDSLEGGERYRHADYARGPFDAAQTAWYSGGFDATTGEAFPFTYTQIVRRNLIPHLSEMSYQGRDLYALRLFRTPVPMLADFVSRRYLSRVYSRQVTRAGPKPVEDWWGSVDAKGTDVGKWFREVVAPIVLAVGHCDLVFGRPETPDGAVVDTKADARAVGLDKCVADVILAENLVWWTFDTRNRYREVLVFERDEDGVAYRWRHWTETESNAYDSAGDFLASESWTHGLGFCPVVRVRDGLKLRCKNTGRPRLEFACEIQRAVYNRMSELVLSDVFHCHALLQGPEEYCKGGAANEKMSYGPGGLLPMKRVEGTTTSYQGFEAIDMPQSGASECREHIKDDLDSLLLHYGLLRPPGSEGTSGATISQSGISKAFDTRDGNDLLAEVSLMLEEAESVAAEFAYRVLAGVGFDEAEMDSIEITYPREFDLFSAEDLAAVMADLQALGGALGTLPEIESEILKRLVTVLLPGLDEDRMRELHGEIDTAVDEAREQDDQRAEADVAREQSSALQTPSLLAAGPNVLDPLNASAISAVTSTF